MDHENQFSLAEFAPTLLGLEGKRNLFHFPCGISFKLRFLKQFIFLSSSVYEGILYPLHHRSVPYTFCKVPTRRILCNNQELLQLVIISFTLTHNRTNAAKALAHKNLTEKEHHNEKWRFIQVETSTSHPQDEAIYS